jgi:hypothetical protein
LVSRSASVSDIADFARRFGSVTPEGRSRGAASEDDEVDNEDDDGEDGDGKSDMPRMIMLVGIFRK